MDRKKNATVEAVYEGGLSICHYKINSTMLEIVNDLCKSADRQGKYLVMAKITTQKDEPITTEKSL